MAPFSDMKVITSQKNDCISHGRWGRDSGCGGWVSQSSSLNTPSNPVPMKIPTRMLERSLCVVNRLHCSCFLDAIIFNIKTDSFCIWKLIFHMKSQVEARQRVKRSSLPEFEPEYPIEFDTHKSLMSQARPSALKERCPPRHKSKVERRKEKVEPLMSQVTVETLYQHGNQ